MNLSEYNFYSHLVLPVFFLIFFGIPILFIFLVCIIPKKPTAVWIIGFALSTISIFIAMQYDHYYLSQPMSDYEYEYSSKTDPFGGETNEGAAVLIGGIPLGIMATSLVFGSFFAGRFALRKWGVLK